MFSKSPDIQHCVKNSLWQILKQNEGKSIIFGISQEIKLEKIIEPLAEILFEKYPVGCGLNRGPFQI